MPQLRPIIISFALLAVVGLGLLFAELVPWQQTLNARLHVKELTFTYAGSREKLFLQQIRPLKTLDIQGTQAGDVFLSGQFRSNDPVLDARLQELDELAIALPDADSRIVITATTPDNDLALAELKLLPGTIVRSLAYFPQSDRLGFSLHSSLDEATDDAIGGLTWGASATLDISLEQAKIDTLGINFDPDEFQETLFTYIPDGTPLTLAPQSGTQVSLSFHAQPSALAPDEFGPDRWIRQDIAARDVRFIHLDKTGDLRDEISVSTILSGKVQLGDRDLSLAANQFLTITPENPGIDRLRNLEVCREDNPGLQVDVSGSHINLVKAGFYPKFPVQTIHSTQLSRIPERFVNTVFSIFIVIVGALVGFVLRASESKPEPKASQPRPCRRSLRRLHRRR